MSLTQTEILQYVALFLALIEFVLALYVLALNARHVANRHVSVLLLLGATTSLAQGLLIGASNAAEAYLPSVILAATVVAVEPALLIVAVVLLKPEWLPFAGQGLGRGRWRGLWYGLYAFALLPAVLTLIDVTFGTQLWYTGLDPVTYQGGAVGTAAFTQGSLAGPIKLLAFQIIPLLTLVPLIYIAFRDRKATPLTRRLAGVLLVQQGFIVAIALGTRGILPSPLPDLLTTAIFVVTYTYVIFQQMTSERRIQRGRLQSRLTALILVVAVPILATVIVFGTLQASKVLEQKAGEQLAATNRALGTSVSVWLDYNVRALQQMTALPDIVSMDPARQKPILELMAATYPHLFLVQTTDRAGMNVARNDAEENRDYSDREWYQGAMTGAPATLQSLVSRTTGQPALNMAAPVRDDKGNIVGVGSIVSQLDDIAREVQVSKMGESGFAYIVDEANRVVAHPDPAYSTELRDLGAAPPVTALRRGVRGPMSFTDEEGQRWQAYVDEIGFGWGVVVQQQERELLGTLRDLQQVSWIMAAAGILILAGLTALTVRQIVRPVGTLTKTATAIAAGDLDRVAPVESDDEIGALALAFNSMTQQLRSLIGNLERQVEERTAELAQRSSYLEATADVSRAVSSILDPDEMTRQMVELIHERFGLYYVGLFLLDPTKEWVVLRAGTGRAGKAMLTRGHRIRVGEGMVGWSVAHSQARVALEVGEDAMRLATEELPETRSEAALPLRSRGQVLGSLTVQDVKSGAFDPATLTVLQAMADQMAVALDNAQLYAQSQAALDAERRAYGELGHQAWAELLRSGRGQGYRYLHKEVRAATGEWRPEMLQAQRTGQIIELNDRDDPTLVVPITLRDQVLAVLRLNKGTGGESWSGEEIALLEELGLQLSVALESARLYEETQQRAAQERLVGEVTSRMRATLDVEAVLQTAAHQIAQAMGLMALDLRLLTGPDDGGGNGQDDA